MNESDDPLAHYHNANGLVREGGFAEVVQHHERTISLAPEYLGAEVYAFHGAIAFPIQAIAAILLFLVLPASAADSQKQVRERTVDPVDSRPASQRSSAEIVKEIEPLLLAAHRALPMEEFHWTHTKIATLVDELRKAYPDDPRLVKYMPNRWESLAFLGRREEAAIEVAGVLATTKDSGLKRDALFFQTILRTDEEVDGPKAASLAESFVQQYPDDNRSGEVLFLAAEKLNDSWPIRIVFIVVLAVVVATIEVRARKRPSEPRRRRRLIIRLAVLAILTLLAAVVCFVRLQDAGLLQDARRYIAMGSFLVSKASKMCESAIVSRRAGFALLAAGVGATILVLYRSRSAGSSPRRTSIGRLWILGFTTTLAACCVLDTCLIVRKGAELKQRLVQEYPDSFRGRMVQGQGRQRERIGKPFELDFTDAISGRRVSIKDFRGKVIVVDFWATWCGPCVHEIPKMLQIYAKYHDQGVEFIGVSHDAPEEDGGLDALKTFVAEKRIPWPQFYEGRNSRALMTGSAMNDFSEFWGINGIPTVFLIDADGNLYSTEARGELETLILRLLRMPNAL